MRHLLVKEFRLALHPTAFIFMSLAAMLIIPNYPYYVTFFYTTLAVFFTCLSGRENKDIPYSMNLPVRKADLVGARILTVVILELTQVALAIPFAFLRQKLPVPNNQVGMEANIAFFGLSFLMMGLFNLSFFTRYYRDVRKVGSSFAISSVAVFLFIAVAEACAHAIPLFRDKLDTLDPAFLGEKLVVLAVGLAGFLILTLTAQVLSVRSFERLDLRD